jgi:hypothetical protein
MLSPHLISRLRKVDWDFAGIQSESRFSALHWHPARFASQLPATLIGLLSEPGQTVLDPFAGSATTLIEAQRLCRRAIGIDLNPVAALLARAKTVPLPSVRVAKITDNLKRDCMTAIASSSRCEPCLPINVQEKWYTAKVRRELAALWSLLERYSGVSKIFAKAAFSGILLPVCRETRHWGYVCDNSTPHGGHAGNVAERYCEILDGFAAAYEDRDADRAARLGNAIERVRVICGDSREELKKIPPASVDLVVTSPPYFGVSDYIKSQRLSMEWFGYEIEPLRRQEIGARSKRHRTSATNEYTTELASVFEAMRTCLKPSAATAVVIGESETRKSVLDETIAQIQETGFKLDLRLTRRVSTLRRQTPSVQGEHILFFS